MASQEEEVISDCRERSCSSGSIISVTPDLPREPKKFCNMNLETLIEATGNIDTSVFDRTRYFNPRKQRSCHKRAEPVSEEHRKMESSKNSREYTKRNRDEISTCRALFNDINAVRNRFRELLLEYKTDEVERKVRRDVVMFEKILRKYLNVGLNMKQRFNLPELDAYLMEYREKALVAIQYEHKPSSPNVHATKLIDLKKQFHLLTNDKDTLNSSKDKTNFASSKSRLNQRIVREHLKSNCWDCWKDINTLTIQGKELQKLLNTLKKQVWDNILAVYYHLFGLFFQQRAQIDVQHIETMVEYFSPFSRTPGKLYMKWTPQEKPVPEVVTIDDDDDDNMETPIKSQSPPTVATKPDGMPPVERPESMDLSKMLKPIIQDRMITTTQFTPPALASPSFTLALPIVPATTIPVQKSPVLEKLIPKTEIPLIPVPTTQKAQTIVKNSDIAVEIEKIEISNQEELNSSRKRIAASSSDETETKKATVEPLNAPKSEAIPDTNAFITQTTAIPQVYPIPMNPAIANIPLPYNPLLYAPPGEMTPLQALTPNFLRAMEQQRIMAAFLNQAFQRVQK